MSQLRIISRRREYEANSPSEGEATEVTEVKSASQALPSFPEPNL